MLKGKMVVKDGSIVLPGCFLVFVCFLFLNLVPEEPTNTVIVCVDLYSPELDSFFNIEAWRHPTGNGFQPLATQIVISLWCVEIFS